VWWVLRGLWFCGIVWTIVLGGRVLDLSVQGPFLSGLAGLLGSASLFRRWRAPLHLLGVFAPLCLGCHAVACGGASGRLVYRVVGVFINSSGVLGRCGACGGALFSF